MATKKSAAKKTTNKSKNEKQEELALEGANDDWSHGYIVETGYTKSFFNALNPAMISFAALMKGLTPIDISKPYKYFELGCGQGLTVNSLASANPKCEFYANDFNPEHIKFANSISKAAGTSNVTFYEKSFEDMCKEKLPKMDFIVLHGIYTWINDENREHIVKFIKKNLKDGGFVYNSYNCYPGHASFVPVRRLLVEVADKVTGTIDQRIKFSLDYIEKMDLEETMFFKQNPKALSFLRNSMKRDRNYLAHELYNRDWTLFFHADVEKEMAEAGLSYIARSNIADNFIQFALTGKNLEFYQTIKEPTLAEMTRDLMAGTQFRADIFHKNRPLLQKEESMVKYGDMRFCLAKPIEECKLEVSIPVGKVTLDEKSYKPILDLLAEKPRTLNEIYNKLKSKEVFAKADLLGFIQNITKLVATNNISPALPVDDEELRIKSARKFNDNILSTKITEALISNLLSPVTGNTINIKKLDQVFIKAFLEGHEDVLGYAADAIVSENASINDNDGKKLSTKEEIIKGLAERADNFHKTLLPFLQLHKMV